MFLEEKNGLFAYLLKIYVERVDIKSLSGCPQPLHGCP